MIDDFGVIVQCFNYIAFGFLFLGIESKYFCASYFVSAQPNRLFRNPILPQGFKHLIDTAFLLLHIGMNIEIQGRGDIGMS